MRNLVPRQEIMLAYLPIWLAYFWPGCPTHQPLQKAFNFLIHETTTHHMVTLASFNNKFNSVVPPSQYLWLKIYGPTSTQTCLQDTMKTEQGRI